MHSLAEELVKGWIDHFYSADHSIRWLSSEHEAAVHLDRNTILMGRLDAIGRDAEDELFFGEWKSSKYLYTDVAKASLKRRWRKSPQALTYGVLSRALYPDMRRFTVRWAFKPKGFMGKPSYDYEWYSYTDEEIQFWSEELISIAAHIRALRLLHRVGEISHFPVNYDACYRYGEAYACPFVDTCHSLDFANAPEGLVKRVSHLDAERSWLESPAGGEASKLETVILDATRVGTWLNCHERYRKEYIEDWREEPGESLTIGTDMHSLLGEYYGRMVGVEPVELPF